MIDAAILDEGLPQLQCRQCGYAGCAPYAEAMARFEAPINLCRPGGGETLAALAEIMGLNPLEYAEPHPDPPQLARIDSASCIGCTRCLAACPVDAIMGARNFLHEILPSECTGCGLCIDPCPTNCIRLVPLAEPTQAGTEPRLSSPHSKLHSPETRARLRQRYQRHVDRFHRALSSCTSGSTDAERLQEIRTIVQNRQKRQTREGPNRDCPTPL
ncbi:MAG: RnfABCDGE type electron transport complex subunit B [Gammaproteobacteria bacterium]